MKGSAATQSVLGKVPELKRSIQNGDYKLAFAIIEKCDEIIRTITETSNLQETLHEYLALRQQVINHLEDQKQTREFNAAVSLFEKYMSVKDPGDDDWVELKHNLNLRFKTLQSFGREIPAQVQHDYNKMVRECDRLQDRMLNSRRLAVIVAIIGVVVIAGLVIVGLTFLTKGNIANAVVRDKGNIQQLTAEQIKSLREFNKLGTFAEVSEDGVNWTPIGEVAELNPMPPQQLLPEDPVGEFAACSGSGRKNPIPMRVPKPLTSLPVKLNGTMPLENNSSGLTQFNRCSNSLSMVYCLVGC